MDPKELLGYLVLAPVVIMCGIALVYGLYGIVRLILLMGAFLAVDLFCGLIFLFNKDRGSLLRMSGRAWLSSGYSFKEK